MNLIKKKIIYTYIFIYEVIAPVPNRTNYTEKQ